MPCDNTVRGFTISRDDIVTLSRNIAAAVPLSLLDNANAPLTIAIKGSYSCGKKIITDSFIEAVMGVEPCPLKGATGWSPENRQAYGVYLGARHAQGFNFQGKDENIKARRIDGAPIELLYVDLLYNTEDLSFCADTPDIDLNMAINTLNAQRQYGGVTFLQNADNLPAEGAVNADIEIWLESKSQNFLDEALRCPQLTERLREIFGVATAEESKWGRYCEVKVNNTALGDVLIASQSSLCMKAGVI